MRHHASSNTSRATLIAVIALGLMMSTLNRLRDFAVLKALGASTARLAGTVVSQVLWTVGLASGVATALAVAVSVQIVGALLVLSLLVTPAAAAMRISSSPLGVPLISVGFALLSVVGGIMLALGSALPISPYVTTISFLIYVVCRIVGGRRARRRTAAATSRPLVSQAG